MTNNLDASAALRELEGALNDLPEIPRLIAFIRWAKNALNEFDEGVAFKRLDVEQQKQKGETISLIEVAVKAMLDLVDVAHRRPVETQQVGPLTEEEQAMLGDRS